MKRPYAALLCFLIALGCLLILEDMAQSAEQFNGIYLGEDVTTNPPVKVAVQITQDGTVIAFSGQIVPGLKDSHGVPVKVRRVELR